MPSPELVWGLATVALDSSDVVDRVTLVWPQLSEVDQTSAETNVSRLAPMPSSYELTNQARQEGVVNHVSTKYGKYK